ncbi:MAG: carotenoid oxygenase family protein [Deltaproteobacteria bacterium]|jgi:carotenoid cleavage dioxygenase|nr:carotenoid oxygenase family protein [Deltaproteobacteria bacterium]
MATLPVTRPLPDRPLLRRHHKPWPIEGELHDITVTQGALPEDLCGTLYRIGPNVRYAPLSGRYNGWMGDGMIHALTLVDGKAHYRNRWVRTPKWRAEDRAGRAVFDYVLPSKALLSTGMEVTRPNAESEGVAQGACNTSVTVHGDLVLAWGEGQSTPTVVDARSLETIGHPSWTKALGDSMTPVVGENGYGGGHPRVCPLTGEVIFTTLDVKPPYVVVHILDPSSGGLRSIPLESPYSSYIHDFMITEQYAVIVVSPITMSQERVLAGGGLMAWEPDRGTHVAVVPRDGGGEGTLWLEAPENFYHLHPQNAYEEAGRIVLDAPEFPIAPVPMEGVDPWQQFEGLVSHLTRYEIDLGRRTLARRRLDDRNVELPQCDRRYQGLPYRYGYDLASGADLDDYNFDTIVRYDMKTLDVDEHRFDESDSLAEPLFAPRSAEAAEGDGYLLTYVYHPAEDRSDAVIFDATRLEDAPVATLALPHRVPFTAHGWWAPGIA